MTLLMPTCERVTALLTAYQEGALGPLDWLGLRLHLALCPPCQVFLDTFERTPALLRRVWSDEAAPAAELALASALAALREGRAPRGPQHHPDAATWSALEPGGDALLAILLRIHLGQCEGCRQGWGAGQPTIELAPRQPPAALAAILPAAVRLDWMRRGLGGSELAQVGQDPITGAALFLARLPEGCQAPPHEHLGPEHSVILRGRLQDGPAHLSPGDWITHPAGDRHGPVADPEGECWCLVHLAKPVRFFGWRRVLNQGTAFRIS